MRNKVVLIRGRCGLAKAITLAEFERINADHVFLIAALRRPQFLPPEFPVTAASLEERLEEVMSYWKVIEQDHFVMSEYASVALDHGGGDVRAVEGNSLNVPWFYETVKAMHRQFGQTVIEVTAFYHSLNGQPSAVSIDGEFLSVSDAVGRLSPHPSLG